MPRRRVPRDPAAEVTEILVDANAEAPPVKPAPRRRRTKNQMSDETQAGLHEIVAMTTAVAFLLVNEAYRPTREEIDAIFQPLERIWLRHTGIGEVNPDVQDGIFALLGVLLYVKRIGLLDRKVKLPGLAGITHRPTAERQPASPAPAAAAANGSGLTPAESAHQSGLRTVDEQLAAFHRSLGEPLRAEG